jgi:hydrogenase-4 component B
MGTASLLSGAALSLAPIRKEFHRYIPTVIGALMMGLYGVLALKSGRAGVYSAGVSSLFDFGLRSGPLQGFFIVVISLIAFAASVYSTGYMESTRNRTVVGFFFNLFVLSMYAVVLAGNILTFLVAWETMSVISYFLVTAERDDRASHAGLVYAVMTHVGTAFIVAAFFLLYRYTGSMDFALMKESAGLIPSGARDIIFLFAMVGFGTKAGVMPLHIWLPQAHPEAPSNVSALMSAVMIKTGIYGLLLVVMDILGGGPEWWGLVVLVAGAVSSALGVMYALMEHDMKRLLAYHSVENIGIILLGLGASMVFKSHSMPSLAALALVAALYHTVNHAVFKGLLFFGAGSVHRATRTKNMEEMGGLLKAMPFTGLFFLAGSVSICALPPFNGFVSEWLTYQALLLGFTAPSMAIKVLAPLGGAALALTGALASACFVKAFGISFLGSARSAHAEGVRESSPPMVAGMGILAVCCLLLGVFPGTLTATMSPVVALLTGHDGLVAGVGYVGVAETMSSLSPGAILLTALALGAAALLFLRAVGGRKRVAMADSWDCGMPGLSPRMQYSATAFTHPIKLIFKRIYLPRRRLHIKYILEPYFVESIRYIGEITPFFEQYLYGPATGLVRRAAWAVRHIQSGSLRLYLGYILVTLMVLLVFGM